ncbi:MAG: lamin tail domain-containing protein [Anaerolineae bacterium]
MHRPRLIGFLCVILLTVAGLPAGIQHPSAATDRNLLHNPGFEAGAAGWHVYPSTATFALVGAPTHEGQAAASLTKLAAKGSAFIFQDVHITAGERYAAQVWALWNDEGLSNIRLRVDWLDAGGDSVAPRDEVSASGRGPEYQLLSLDNLEAPAGSVSARIQGYTYVDPPDPDQPALFDDFSFAAMGPPTATLEPSPTATTTPTVVLLAPTPTTTATPSPVPAGAVLINEILYDPPARGGDPDDEWVELYNALTQPINLGDWVLADHIGEDVLPVVELPAGGFAIVAATISFSRLYPDYDGPLITLGGPIGNGLANTGDSLWLRDDHGRIIDAVAYGDDTVAMFPSVPAALEGYSLERIPYGLDTDTAADWFPREVPSPGQGINIWRLYLPLVVR